MVMPSAGVRPMGTSQKTRLVPTPLPSGDGQSTSAGAIFFAGGGAGLRVVVRVCAPAWAGARHAISSRRTRRRRRIARSIPAAHRREPDRASTRANPAGDG